MVTADEVAEQLREVLNIDVKAFAGSACVVGGSVRAIRHPERPHRTRRRNVFEAVNAGWMATWFPRDPLIDANIWPITGVESVFRKCHPHPAAIRGSGQEEPDHERSRIQDTHTVHGDCELRSKSAPCVTGIDLARPIDDATRKKLNDAVVENVVLVIRGQEHLTPGEEIASGGRDIWRVDGGPELALFG